MEKRTESIRISLIRNTLRDGKTKQNDSLFLRGLPVDMTKDPKDQTFTRLIDQRPNSVNEVRKPQELIQIRGHDPLSLTARRAITVLWHNAHSQGLREDGDYTIEVSRLRTDGHHGTDYIVEAIEALMQTIVVIQMPDGSGTRRVQMLGGNDLNDDSRDRAAGVLTYSFDRRLVQALQDSRLWGPIELPVLMSFASKYSVSLYEHLCQWVGLDRVHSKLFSLDEFRELLGVEDGRYATFGDLNRYVIKPAIAEICALAPFNASIQPVKEGRRVAELRLHWWEKTEKEKRQAYQESERPRVGRRARIEGRVEHLAPSPSQHTLAKRARAENSKG